MSDEFPNVYPYSCEEARSQNQLSLWRESHRENIACKNAIEEAIRRNFDGMHLKSDCAQSVINQYGFTSSGCWQTPYSKKIGTGAFPATTKPGQKACLFRPTRIVSPITIWSMS